MVYGFRTIVLKFKESLSFIVLMLPIFKSCLKVKGNVLERIAQRDC